MGLMPVRTTIWYVVGVSTRLPSNVNSKNSQVKPFSSKELLARVKKHVEIGRRRRGRSCPSNTGLFLTVVVLQNLKRASETALDCSLKAKGNYA